MTPETLAAPSSSPAFTAGSRSVALHEAELEHLAPGTQSVALFSKLAIDHGERRTDIVRSPRPTLRPRPPGRIGGAAPGQWAAPSGPS